MIRRKDGSIFRLDGPNPMMNDQDVWSDYKVHNFEQEKLHNFTINEPIKVEPPRIEFPKTVEEKKEPPKTLPKMPNKKMFFCLPAEVKVIDDILYGEQRVNVRYFDPFKFEGILVHNGDIEFKVWTDLDINKGSILYYDEDRRWWKVETKDERGSGHILNCMPSEEKPYFGDL